MGSYANTLIHTYAKTNDHRPDKGLGRSYQQQNERSVACRAPFSIHSDQKLKTPFGNYCGENKDLIHILYCLESRGCQLDNTEPQPFPLRPQSCKCNMSTGRNKEYRPQITHFHHLALPIPKNKTALLHAVVELTPYSVDFGAIKYRKLAHLG